VRGTLPATFAALLACTACADGPGHGFATLESATLHASFEPGVARDLGGAVLTNRGYQVSLEALELDVESISLEALEGAGSGALFDPSHPPAGYSLCHGGHCHADDGRLVEYADVEAELAGGSASFEPIVTLRVAEAVALVPARELALHHFEPSGELPETTLRRIVVSAAAFRARGSILGGALPASGTPLFVELEGPFAFTRGLMLMVDRKGPEKLELRVRLGARGTLFDDLELAELAGAQGIRIVDRESEPALRLGVSLLESRLEVAF
jgi:hypothetical protein